jgi:hypothetical protein
MHPDGWMDGWMDGGDKKDANYVWPLEPFKKEMKRCAYLVF